MKTAELFTLSCDLAAFLSKAAPEHRTTLRKFGSAVGTAYQIYDDCVDLFGSEAVAGKSLGTDLAKGKLTWPVLLAWERANGEDRAMLENLIQNWVPESFPIVNGLLAKYQTFEPTMSIIYHYLEQARGALLSLPPSAGRTGLSLLTDYLAQQTLVLAV
jgi:octaprenyl-diphosphate synthase